MLAPDEAGVAEDANAGTINSRQERGDRGTVTMAKIDASKIDFEAARQKATLYYASRTFPNNGCVTEHVWFRGLDEPLCDTGKGKFVFVVMNRKRHRKDKRSGAAFGHGDDLVIVRGWQKEYNNHTIGRLGSVTTMSPRFNTATNVEWVADFGKFLHSLRESGVEVIADYRDVDLGPVPLSTGFKGAKSQPSAKSQLPVPPLKTPPPVITPETIYEEGATATVMLDAYERDRKARSACIEHHRPICQICNFDFATRYPGVGGGISSGREVPPFIEVHHLTPLSENGEAHVVDPIKDLIPVCPNCHAMLHRKRPPYTPDQLRAIMNGAGAPDRATDVRADEDDIPF